MIVNESILIMNSEAYVSPIKVLYEDLKTVFESCNTKAGGIIDEAIANGKLNGVHINTDEQPAKTAKSHIDEGIIEIQETYMAYLWTVCYLMIGLEAIYRKLSTSKESVVRLSDAPEFGIINQVFTWGRSLKSEFSRWPNGLPKPTGPTEDEHLTNRLFIYTMRYMMYHEFAHNVLHSQFVDFVQTVSNPFYDLNTVEKNKLREMEIQADDYAFDLSYSHHDQQERYMAALSAIVANISNFYIRDDADTRDTTHTDIDTRLQRVLSKIGIEIEPYRTYLQLTSTVGLQVFMTLTDVSYLETTQVFSQFTELQSYLMGIIEDRKHLYNLHRPVKY